MSTRRDPPVFVVGGGIAGLSAAWALVRAGVRTELLEAGPVLGGRFATNRWIEADVGDGPRSFPIEHGVHGFWPSYATLNGFVDAVGATDRLVPVVEEDFVMVADGSPVRRFEYGVSMGRTRIPAPFGTLALSRQLDFHRALWDRGAWGAHRTGRRSMHAVAFDPERDRGLLDGLRLSDFIHRWPAALSDLAASLSHSGFFTAPEQACLPTFFEGLQHYVLERPGASTFQVLDADTEAALIRPIVDQIEAGGGKVTVSRPVERLDLVDGRVTGVYLRGRSGLRRRNARAVVLATDPPGFRRVAEQTGSAGLAGVEAPEGAATTAVRLWFDKRPERVTSMGMFGNDAVSNYFWLTEFLAPYLDWARATGGAAVECHLYGPQSDWCDDRDDEEVARAVQDVIVAAWPELAGRRIHHHIARYPATHTVMGPGFQRSSPPVQTPVDNVFLCGDWVRAPWSCFYLERAAVTGRLAAEGAAAVAGGSFRPEDRPIPGPGPSSSFRAVQKLARGLRDAGLLAGPVGWRRWREHRRGG